MSSVPVVTYDPLPGQTVTIPIASIPFTSGLTTPLQASVSNPALGFATIFVNNSEQLCVTDATGNTYVLLNSPLAFDANLNAHQLLDALRLGFSAGVQLDSASSAPATGIAIGQSAVASTNAVAMSSSASANADSAVSIGNNSRCNFIQGVAVGNATLVTGNQGTAVGDAAGAFTGGAAFGGNATAGGQASTALGPSSSAAGLQASAMGNSASAVGNQSIAIGNNASASVTDSIAIGDGAVNATTNTCLIGNSAIANIRSNNSLFACDLGTSAAPFKSCWLRDASPAAGSKFSQYSSVSVTNTVAETSLLTGTQVGSMVYSAGQSLGSVIRFKFGTVLTVGVADTVTVRIKVNGVTAVSAVLGGSVFAAVPGYIAADLVVQAANLQCSMQAAQNGAGAGVTIADPAYNPAIANTFSVTAQWSAASAGDTLTVNYCYIESLFAQ